jgi:hypothetical protein
MTSVSLFAADLYNVALVAANLEHADLSRARLIKTDLRRAILRGARVYGTAVWDVGLQESDQREIVITPPDVSAITVDNLEVAQFIYLLLNNERIRDVLDTITSKVVLILGRFRPERKAVLDALRLELGKHNYTPIIFDFDKPANRNITETVSTLAHMARFVIADITDAKSIPQELERIVPGLPSLPVQPIILSSQYEYAMFKDFLDYPWVLLPHRYTSSEDLISSLAEKVVGPALTKSREIEEKRRLIESEFSRR